MRLVREGDAVHASCPAKLNLVLAVLGKRADGYHEIDSVLVKLDVPADPLIARPIPSGIELELTAPEDIPRGPDNLAWKAAAKYLESSEVTGGIRIQLLKRIPSGSGLGGGSSNAAGVLAACAELFGPLPAGRMESIAAEIGSDVPFFLGDWKVARARGRGEVLETVTLRRPLPFALHVPPLGCATAKVYSEWKPEDSRPRDVDGLVAALAAGDLEGIGKRLGNDLLAPCLRAYPWMREAVDEVESLGRPWSLTGSGSALFYLGSAQVPVSSLRSHGL